MSYLLLKLSSLFILVEAPPLPAALHPGALSAAKIRPIWPVIAGEICGRSCAPGILA